MVARQARCERWAQGPSSLAHQARCERWAQGPSSLARQARCERWAQGPSSLAHQACCEHWAQGPSSLAHQACCERWAQGPSSLARQARCKRWAQGPSSLSPMAHYGLACFATATGGLAPPRRKCLACYQRPTPRRDRDGRTCPASSQMLGVLLASAAKCALIVLSKCPHISTKLIHRFHTMHIR